MAASDIRAGKAFVEMYLKNSISQNLDKVKKQLDSFGSALKSIGTKSIVVGTALTAPFLLASKIFAEMGDQLNKASDRTGVTVESLSALKYAAEQSGASFEGLENGLRKMQKTLFEAETGSKQAREALGTLGLTVDDLKNLSPDQQFLLIADRLSDVTDAGAKAAVGMEIFGKGAGELLPLIAAGKDGIKELTDRARELGLVISKEDAEAATKFGDILDDLGKQFKMVAFEAGAAIANALQPFAEAAVGVMSGVIAWVKANRSLAVGIVAVGAALIVGGAAFVAFGVAVQGIVAGLGGVGAVLGVVASALAFLLNPITLVAAGLVALAAYFTYSSGAGAEAIDFLAGKFDTLAAVAKKALGGIVDALAAGDLLLAAQILWTGLQVAWSEGTRELNEKWIRFKALFVKTAAGAFYGVLEIYQNVKASLLSAFEETTAFFGELWQGFTGVFTDAWDKAVNVVAKGLFHLKGLFDSTFDVKSATGALDKTLGDRLDQRTKEAFEKSKQRDEEKRKNIEDIHKAQEDAIKDIQQREGNLAAGADAQADQEIGAAKDKLAALKAQLEAQRQQAAGERAQKDAEKGPEAKKRPGPFDLNLDELLKNREDVADPRKFHAAGVFNADAVQTLTGGLSKVEDRIAKAAEDTAKNTKKIADKKGLVFG